jgi:hypothetical protein
MLAPKDPLQILHLHQNAEKHAVLARHKQAQGQLRQASNLFDFATRLRERAMDQAWELASTWPKELA